MHFSALILAAASASLASAQSCDIISDGVTFTTGAACVSLSSAISSDFAGVSSRLASLTGIGPEVTSRLSGLDSSLSARLSGIDGSLSSRLATLTSGDGNGGIFTTAPMTTTTSLGGSSGTTMVTAQTTTGTGNNAAPRATAIGAGLAAVGAVAVLIA